MSSNDLQPGDLVVARFRPDNVGVVERVYGDLCDIRRPGKEPLQGAPLVALTPAPADVTLYAVGQSACGVIWTKGVVAGAEGLLSWMRHQTPAAVAEASLCVVDRRFQPLTQWEALADVLAEKTAKELGII